MWRLKQAGYVCAFRCVVNEIEMRAALRAELPDLILSDFSLPAFDGMSALAIARAEAPGVPFIFLSGTIGEERAIEALKCGAIDYVLKSNPKRLVPAVERALQEAPLRRASTPVGSCLCGTGSTVIGRDELLLLEEVAANLSFALQYLDKQDAVHFLSYFEPLTGLAKRALFCERLSRLLIRGTDSLPRLEITVFDITHLSVINDSFGRHTGDRLLQCVADRLKAHFPDTEQLAHLGGGTFACVNASRERADAKIRTLHEDVARVFGRPLSVDGREIIAEIKSGVACYPDDGREANELVQNAEAALKEAKTSGERYLHHRVEMNSELARRVGLEQRLRTALDKGQFLLHYQPKIK